MIVNCEASCVCASVPIAFNDTPGLQLEIGLNEAGT